MSSSFETYLSHLWEIGRDSISRLSAEDYDELSVRLIRQTPTKLLPFFENYDKSRDVLCMMSKWIETEDDQLGHDILQEMKKHIITAMTPMIEDQMYDYTRREEIAIRETRENERLEGISFDRQRI